MDTYEDILSVSIEEAVAATVAQVKAGQRAQTILTDELITGFFQSYTRDLVTALMTVDVSNVENVRAIVVGIRAVGALHGHLTDAVSAGQSATQRLHDEEKKNV